jgi:hypothetical protein
MAQLLGPVRGFTSAAVVSLMQRSDQIIAVRQAEIGSLLLLPVLRETVLKYSSYSVLAPAGTTVLATGCEKTLRGPLSSRI